MDLAIIEAGVAETGLNVRGAFHPTPEDGVPDGLDGGPARTLVLVGNAGPKMWQEFTVACDPGKDLLDDWTSRVLDPLGRHLGAQVFYPFAQPYMPFQRWAMRAEPVAVSPLGILIHPQYGLWHGYRGAFAFAHEIDIPPLAPTNSPCDACPDKPCLTTCPVGAFDESTGYDVPACTTHIESSEGAACLNGGCVARHACPVGREYIYTGAQARLHMSAFLRNNRSSL